MPPKGRRYTPPVKKRKNQPRANKKNRPAVNIPQPSQPVTSEPSEVQMRKETAVALPVSAKYASLSSELRRVAVVTGLTLILMIVLWLILK